jgi:hypothetical protein
MSYPHLSRAASTAPKPLWDFTLPEIEGWIRRLSPNALFPKQPTLATSDGTQDKVNNDALIKQYQDRMTVGNVMLQNLRKTLSVASDTTNGEPAAKKARVAYLHTQGLQQGDVYNILDPSFSKQNNTVAEGEGAIMSRLTLGGLVNALAGAEGGVVDTVTCIPLSDLIVDANGDANNNGSDKKKGLDAVIETAGGLTLKELIKIGSALHRSVSAR